MRDLASVLSSLNVRALVLTFGRLRVTRLQQRPGGAKRTFALLDETIGNIGLTRFAGGRSSLVLVSAAPI